MRSSLRSSVRAVLAGLIFSAAGCAKHQSFVVLTLAAADQAIVRVDTVEVAVTGAGAGSAVTLTYPGKSSTIGVAGSLINPPVTLSVSFSNDRDGPVTLAVAASNAAGCRVATGSTTANVQKDTVTSAAVTLTSNAPICPTDGGVGDGGDQEVAPFPGCDPAAAATCGADKTCFVDCKAGQGLCVPAGPSGPGQSCPNDNSACTQGTQCFDYSTTEAQCNVQVCLKFCKTDSDCTSATGIGLGAGSLCVGPVDCNGVPTGHKTCTFGCDPRGLATTNCPTGLGCLLIGEQDQVDCRCVPAGSVKNEGDTCAVFADCRPGLICTTMGTDPKKCRRLCKAGSTGDCPTGQSCTMLKNDTLYGICQ
ncbi:MAG TPA: hypothetical protein VH374_16890 [Polyangia bacterium]|nr:hypothetical protein [Polyangia bacterium]